MTPTKFLNNDISIKQNFSNMNGMISTNLIIRHTFILTWVFIFIKAFTKYLFQRIEIFLIMILILFIGFVGTRLDSIFGMG